MPDRISLFTSNVEPGRLSQVLYTYGAKESYVKNLISYIHEGLRLGQHILLVDINEMCALLRKELSVLTEDEYNRIHYLDTFGSSTDHDFFNLEQIIETAQEISDSQLIEHDIRFWRHTNEKMGYGKISDENLSIEGNLDSIGMLCVHAYNGTILSALEENRLLRNVEYFMTDTALVHSPLYQGQVTSTAILPYINDTQKSLQAAVELHERKEDFIQILAHELRNPLTVIKGYAELLLRGNLSQDVADQEKMQSIADYTNVIDEEIQNILRIEKVLSEDAIWERKPINLRGTLQRTLNVMRSKAKFRNITIKSHVNLSDQDIIYFNGAALRLIVSNIVSNAIKYSSEESIVDIHVAMEHSSLKLSVEDHGEGMTEEQVRNLFHRFGKMNHDTEGHGIGLFAVKSIVEKFNGIINVQSEIQVGTKITVHLPTQVEDSTKQLH